MGVSKHFGCGPLQTSGMIPGGDGEGEGEGGG